MTLEEFLKHIYHTERYIIIPDMDRLRIDKSTFFNKKGRLDNEAMNNHLKKLYHSKYK